MKLFKHYGTSLVEILISILLISLILLGLDGAQLTSMQQANLAYTYSVAAQQVININERLKAANFFEQIVHWNSENQQILPQGRGVLSGEYILIYWGNTPDGCVQNRIQEEGGCLRQKIF